MFVYNEALAWELVQKHQQLELTHATMQFLARTRLGLVCFLPSGLRGVSRFLSLRVLGLVLRVLQPAVPAIWKLEVFRPRRLSHGNS